MPRTKLHTIAQAVVTVEPEASTEPSLPDQLAQVEAAIDAQAARVEELRSALDALNTGGKFIPAAEGARNLLEGIQSLLDSKQSECERAEALEAAGSLLAKESAHLEELEAEQRRLTKRIQFEQDRSMMAAAIAQVEQKFEAAAKLYQEALQDLKQAEAQVDRSNWGDCILQEIDANSMQSHMVLRTLTIVVWPKPIPAILKDLPRIDRISYGCAVR